MSAAEDLTGRIDALTEQLADAQRLWLVVSRRQDDVEQLAHATDRLSESTTSVEDALRTVGQAQAAAREAKHAADSATVKVDESLVELAKSEHRYRRRSRLLAVAAIAVSLLVTGGAGWFFVHWTNQTNGTRYRLCQERAAYDQANHASVGADVTYYRTQLRLIHANRENTAALFRQFPPKQAVALRIEQKAGVTALRKALAAKEKAFSAGVVGQCGSLPH